MIDIHCHILPELDDGAVSMEEALRMAEIACADGIQCIVATPHLNGRHTVPDMVAARYKDLQQGIADLQLPLQLRRGGEVAYPVQHNRAGSLTLARSRYLLLELPHDRMPFTVGESIFNLVAEGYRPIIAHPERNASVLNHPEKLLSLLDMAALVQITGASITGSFGPDVQACARYLLKKGAVHFLASDAHDAGSRRPILSRGLKAAAKIIGKKAALRLVTTNPAKVLADEPIV